MRVTGDPPVDLSKSGSLLNYERSFWFRSGGRSSRSAGLRSGLRRRFVSFRFRSGSLPFRFLFIPPGPGLRLAPSRVRPSPFPGGSPHPTSGFPSALSGSPPAVPLGLSASAACAVRGPPMENAPLGAQQSILPDPGRMSRTFFQNFFSSVAPILSIGCVVRVFNLSTGNLHR